MLLFCAFIITYLTQLKDNRFNIKTIYLGAEIMKLQDFFSISLAALGIAAMTVFIVVCIGMLLYGSNTGADKIKQNPLIKHFIYPLANAIGGISLVFTIISGLLLFVSKNNTTEPSIQNAFEPSDLALYSIAFGILPLIGLLVGAITQPILGRLSKALMTLSMFVFYTIPIGLIGLLISGIWWLMR